MFAKIKAAIEKLLSIADGEAEKKLQAVLALLAEVELEAKTFEQNAAPEVKAFLDKIVAEIEQILGGQ